MNKVPQIFYNHMRASHPSEAFRMSLATKVVKNKNNNTGARARELDPRVRKQTVRDIVRLLLYVYMLYQPGYPPEDYPYSYEEYPEWSDYYSRDQLVLQQKHANRVLQEAQRTLRKMFLLNVNTRSVRKELHEMRLVDEFEISDKLVRFMTVNLEATHAKNAKLVTDLFDFLDPRKIQRKKRAYIKAGLQVLSQTHGNTNVGKAMLSTQNLPNINRNDISSL